MHSTHSSLCHTGVISGQRHIKVGGQAVLGRQHEVSTPWLTERHGYDPTYGDKKMMAHMDVFVDTLLNMEIIVNGVIRPKNGLKMK